MKALMVIFLSAGWAGAATISQVWELSSAFVPDNNAAGRTDTRTITTTIGAISSIEVHLEISGGWNGDLYASLSHGSGFSVLLNRIGKTAANPFGFSAGGMDVTFTHSATQDIHVAGIFSGQLLPDGRNVSPYLVTDTSPRTATLASFTGLDPNGQWTLLVADVSPVAQSKVVSWGLTIHSAEIVPEPSGAGVLALLLGCGLAHRRRR